MIKNTSATAIMPDSKISDTERAVSDLDCTNARRIRDSPAIMPSIHKMLRFASVSVQLPPDGRSVIGCMKMLLANEEVSKKKAAGIVPATVVTQAAS